VRPGPVQGDGLVVLGGQAVLGEDLPDTGVVERGALGVQPGTDLIDRQALAAQLDHSRPDAGLGRGGLGAGLARRGEQLQPPARKSRSKLAMLARV
jgi:hypothetical protein